MLLTNGEVNTIEVFDKQFPIITNARHWINKTVMLEQTKNSNARVDIILNCLANKKDRLEVYTLEPVYIKRLFNKILDFYHCEYETCNDYKPAVKNTNKLYDFVIDSGRIFSAFYKTYGIDIEEKLDTIHWWKFMAMFNDLSSETIFKGTYMHFRGYDRNSSEYRKAKVEHKKIIDDFIARCVLDK